MAKLTLAIEAEGERTDLTELQHLISQAIDKSSVSVSFTSSTVNHAGPDVATAQAVRLSDLIGESSSRNARKAITVLERYAGVIWLSQLQELSEEDVLNIHYFGTTLLPHLEELLKKHGITWPI